MTERLASLLGIVALLGIAYACSTDRRRVPWRIVAVGILLQIYLALFLVRVEWVPVTLTAAAAICAGILLLDGVRPLGGHWAPTARGLGLLGFWVTVVWAIVLGGKGMLGLSTLAALAGFGLLLWARPDLRRSFRAAATLSGCVAPVVLLWRGALPHDFVFRSLEGLGRGVSWVAGFAAKGADQVFGGLRVEGGFVFAIEVGSIILLFSALLSVLYYVGFLPWLVGWMARLLHRALGVSGAESLATASNIFLGQTEAPLVVRPYLDRMTQSETNALMTGGFATIAGSVLAAYVQMLNQAGLSRGAADLIAASVMSAPAAFVFAKLFVPETEIPETLQGAKLEREQVGSSLLDALAGGVTAGLRLAINVVAMLLVFYALIAMLNAAVDWAAREFLTAEKPVTFQRIYSYAFWPLAWMMGVPFHECLNVGQLLGTKTIFNEFVGYMELAGMLRDDAISPRAAVLSTYALCGFANFMSIGIQIGGLSGLCPARRTSYVKLAFRAMVAGTFACQLTACIVSLLY